ncbi:MAG: transcriptional regulator, GntR family [Conexibacter sp.]|nr:transcriptional regulator, GntR family [Conexibacter sp.]
MEDPKELSVQDLTALDADSGVPAYRQIADGLEAQLASVAVGARLPSESEIAKRFGVSRGTAVQSLRELEQRNLVVRVQGRGTFRSSPPPGRFTRSLDAGRLPSFTDDLQRAGHATREQVLRCERLPATAEVAAALGLAGGVEVWLIERTVLADDIAVVHIRSALRADRYPEVDRDAIAIRSLYGFLEDRYGQPARPTWAEEEYSACDASADLAAELGVPVERALLCSRRVAYLTDGHAVELVLSYMRSDAYRVRVTLMPADGERTEASGVELRADLP